MWLLRLSIATYKMKRVIRIRKVVSGVVVAIRGMTVGFGFATTEMRVVMINLVEKTLEAHPSVTPTLFVDDLAAEAAGPDLWIEEELGGFIIIIADGFRDNQFELSRTKSLVTASTDALGKKMEKLWEEAGIFIKRVRNVKALGVGLGAGVRRNVDVMRHRLRTMKKRVPRFRRLRKLGISTSRLLRTRAKAAMTYDMVAWMRIAVGKHNFTHDDEGIITSGIRIELNGFQHAVGIATVRLLRRATVESPHRAIVERIWRFRSDTRFSA